MDRQKKTAKLNLALNRALKLVPEVLKETGKPAVATMTAHLGACKRIIAELKTDKDAA